MHDLVEVGWPGVIEYFDPEFGVCRARRMICRQCFHVEDHVFHLPVQKLTGEEMIIKVKRIVKNEKPDCGAKDDLEQGLADRREGRVVPWEQVKAELGLDQPEPASKPRRMRSPGGRIHDENSSHDLGYSGNWPCAEIGCQLVKEGIEGW